MIIMHINTQKDFEELSSVLWMIIKERQSKTNKVPLDITIQFDDGIFYFNKENFIDLSLIQDANLSITFQGSGNTVITARSDNNNEFKQRMAFVTEEFIKPSYSFFKKLWYFITFRKLKNYDEPKYPSEWEDKLYTADSLIEVVDRNNKLCALPYKQINKISDANTRDSYIKQGISYINVLQQFKSNYYKIEKIEDNKIFFICTDLVYDEKRDRYSINADYNFGKKMPMFRLSNVGSSSAVQYTHDGIVWPKKVKSGYACPYTRFIKANKTKIRRLDISGISFIGNACNDNDVNDALIYISNSPISVSINNCQFSQIYSNALYFSNGRYFNVSNCEFKDCWKYGVYANELEHAVISLNTFYNMGLEKSNNACIRCDAAYYEISHNLLENFGYNGICVGTWLGTKDLVPCAGKVKYNKLTFHKNYSMHLMDSGAIYLLTQQGDTHVEENEIDNYSGRYYNRGIFCDDGAYGFAIERNVIKNIKNSYCIDSRFVDLTNDARSKLTCPTNIKNKMIDNYIDGPIKFEGNAKYVNEEDGCILIGVNRPKPASSYNDVISNLYICKYE